MVFVDSDIARVFLNKYSTNFIILLDWLLNKYFGVFQFSISVNFVNQLYILLNQQFFSTFGLGPVCGSLVGVRMHPETKSKKTEFTNCDIIMYENNRTHQLFFYLFYASLCVFIYCATKLLCFNSIASKYYLGFFYVSLVCKAQRILYNGYIIYIYMMHTIELIKLTLLIDNNY